MKSGLFQKMFILLLILPALACGLFTDDPTPTPETAVQVEPSNTPPPTETAAPPATPTDEPTPTVDVTADFVTFESEELGLSVQHPADWAVQDFFVLLLGTDEEAFDAPGIIQEGAIMVLAPDTTESLGGTDPVALVNDAVTEFDLSEDTAIVEGPTAVTIQGQSAAIARIEGTSEETGAAMVGLVVVIVNGENAVVGLGFTPQASESEYLPTIEAIMNTIVVSEPVETEPEPEPEVTIEPPSNDNAAALSVGDSFDSTVEENSARDFIFSGQAGNTVTIVVEPQDDDLDLVIEIFDAELNSLLKVDDEFGGSETAVFSPPADGDYFVRVNDYFGDPGSFTISVTAGGPGAPEAEQQLVPGQLTDGSLSGDPVSYSFAGTAGQPAVIVLLPDEDLDPTLTIIGSDGAVVVQEVDDGFSGEAEAVSYTPVTDGEFVVLVDAFGSVEGSYRIFLVDPAAAFTAEGNAPQDSSQNYRVCVPANAFLVVFVDPEEDFDLVVNLNGPGGGQLIDQTDNGFSGEPEVVILTEGDFLTSQYAAIVAVSGFAGQSGSFSILITATSPDGVVIDGC